MAVRPKERGRDPRWRWSPLGRQRGDPQPPEADPSPEIDFLQPGTGGNAPESPDSSLVNINPGVSTGIVLGHGVATSTSLSHSSQSIEASQAQIPEGSRPVAKKLFRVLYLFAGRHRKASVQSFLACLCKRHGLQLHMQEFDFLRSPKHDLTRLKLQSRLRSKIASCFYHLVLSSPPCNTFSRARENPPGPKPMRSATHLRGFPWLRGNRKRLAEIGTTLADFSLDAIETQAHTGGMMLMEHPEDLGKCRNGNVPASVWRFPAAKRISQIPGCTWIGVRQSDYGTPYAKPTRLLGRMKGMEALGFLGPPEFDAQGFYKGPIPQGGAHQVQLVGRTADGFRTGPTAAWPPRLCEAIAKIAVEAAKQGEGGGLVCGSWGRAAGGKRGG